MSIIETSLSTKADSFSKDSDYHEGNVLTKQDSSFKQASESNYDSCMWPTFIVHPNNFTLSGEDIDLPLKYFERSFEYASLWVEHYYRPLILECKRFDKLDIIQALYQWYTAQFTFDYIKENHNLTIEQFQYASYLSLDETFLKDLDPNIRCILEDCHILMKMYTTTMSDLLPFELYMKIKTGTDSFFKTSVDQIRASSKIDDFDKMTIDEYVYNRAINAGGVFGFVEQCRLLNWFNPEEYLLEEQILTSFSHHVGLHVALVNDIYGLERDIKTGDLNIILKYELDMNCSRETALEWATKQLQSCVLEIESVCDRRKHSTPKIFNVAMDCIAGNHGAHEISKRYRLPPGFSWPEECSF